MRRWISLVGAGVLMLALLSGANAAAHGQEPDSELQLGPVDVSDHPELSTILTAPGDLSQQTLEAGAVTVTEGGEEVPSKVELLAHNRLEVVLVLDTSGSMEGEPFASAKVAASAFIARLPLEARVALVAFGTEVRLASELTDDRNTLIAAIQQLNVGTETSLYDAVMLATEQFSGDAGSRRSIVLLSDGGDTTSKETLESVTGAVKATGARLDVVELPSDAASHDALVRLADSGGGGIAAAGDPAALAGIYDEIAASLASEYRLTWTSGSFGPTAVVVKVEQDGVVASRTMDVVLPRQPDPKPQPATAKPKAATAADSDWTLIVGAVCFAAALFILGLFLFAPRVRSHRLARLGTARATVRGSTPLTGLADRATGAAEAVLARHGRRHRLNERLEQAGLDLRPGEYLVLSLAAVLSGMAIGWIVAGPVLALGLATLAAVGSHATLSGLRTRRQSRFSDQLCESLQHLAGALRAGHGTLQAIEALSREAPEPTSTEFRRLVVEARLGRDFSESLHAMSARIGTDDFDWVVQAIDIQREVGGDLAEVLDTIAATVRERNQLFRQVKTLTAEGRLSAYILLGLPFVMAGALAVMNPDYIRMLTFGPGLVIVGVSALMMVAGMFWFRKLCRLEF